jgi:hypothetical protein
MAARQHGDRIRTDLVGYVAVRRDAVRAHDDRIDASAAQEKSGSAVRNQRDGNRVALELPRRQPRALQEWARLIRIDVDRLAGFDRGADDAERGAVARGGKRAGIAVRQHARTVTQ